MLQITVYLPLFSNNSIAAIARQSKYRYAYGCTADGIQINSLSMQKHRKIALSPSKIWAIVYILKETCPKSGPFFRFFQNRAMYKFSSVNHSCNAA